MKPPSLVIPDWKFDPHQLRILLALELSGSVQGVGILLGRDPSVIGRSLQRMTEDLPVAEKVAGRWTLTPLGRALNRCSRETIAMQDAALGLQSLTIVCAEEIAPRILIPHWRSLLKAVFPSTPRILVVESTEAALLDRSADLALTFTPVEDPSIRFYNVRSEPLLIVGAPTRFPTAEPVALEVLRSAPALARRGHPLSAALGLETDLCKVQVFPDLATTRAAAVAGLGWALLPLFAVEDELEDGRLKTICAGPTAGEKLILASLRNRHDLRGAVEALHAWLQPAFLKR